MFARFGIIFWCLLFLSDAVGQESNVRERKIASTTDAVFLDTLSLYPHSLSVYCGDTKLAIDAYEVDLTRNTVRLLAPCSDSVLLRFRVLPIMLSQVYQRMDTTQIYNEQKGDREKFLIQTKDTYNAIFGNSGLQKNGSISRGVSFGNNQDLSVNSTLNLQLSGDLAPNLKILASVSDDNLPIQPDGNTNKLQEFDQVFVQLYNDKFKLIAGDFWIQKPTGYFLNYRKRAQGLFGEYSWKSPEGGTWKIQGSGALSKGKFARQIIQGIEGNQGPYRLLGNENEPFIIVLSGTEKVFIDGRLLERGQEYDYMINYNTAELIFTSRNLITKDVRIVVEFQYSDQNYARSLVQGSANYSTDKLDVWVNAYSEQDAKNQTIQQDLTLGQKQLLADIGDSLQLARTNSIDSIGFLETQNLYKLIDSMGYDSVLVYSINPENAFYRATFTLVGQNQGDYVLANFNALGKVYRWVAPVNGVPQGNYAPARVIITPKQKQMVNAGFAYKLRKNLRIESEFAYTREDLNTFSRKDANDDEGWSNRTRLVGTVPLSRDSLPAWKLQTRAEIEFLQVNFRPIEQYRTVEFDRDWNTRGKGFEGNQISSTLEADFQHTKHGNLAVEATHYAIGDDFSGIRSRVHGNWNQNGFSGKWDGSLLSSGSVGNNLFVRHRADFSQRIKQVRIGFKDDQEYNTFRFGDSLGLQSYSFFDYEFYLASGDTSAFKYKVYYRERLDQRSDSLRLADVAKARNGGAEIGFTTASQRVNFILNYRELNVLNNQLLNQTPENTLLGRVDYELKLWKSAFTWNTFYEVGSGLELRREFLYVKVNDGQGIYTWIDYNGDGIKDLNEFELAQFVDQASYIRVFTPSNTYTKTYSNELNQGIYLRPERVWANKTGVKRFLARFSDQARLRINRKTNSMEDGQLFNPFAAEVRDTNLISTTSNIRNSLFFNRTNTIFGAEYAIQDIRSKTLLASGFDARSQFYQEIGVRWNIARKFLLENTFQWGNKIADADYTTGRNFEISYFFTKPAFSYQPSTSLRVTLDGRYSDKKNVAGERSVVQEIGTKIKYNEAKKGSFQGGISLITIRYTGAENSALGFEMLEALKPGRNYTWNIGYQRSISKNLQLSVQYNGRKSEANQTIHSGGMEVRAFF